MFSAKHVAIPEVSDEDRRIIFTNFAPEFDWREEGKVTAVRTSNMSCSDSYAQASVAAPESAWAIKNDELVEMSV